MKRVVVLPSDESACGYYRMRLPAGAVQQVRPDWSVEVYRPSEVKMGTGSDGKLWSVQGIPDPASIDLLVMQRVATQAQSEFFKLMRDVHGTAVIMDADDAMWCIDPDNTAWSAWNNRPGRLNPWIWMDRAGEIADLVTVTTPSLAQRYGKHGRSEILPNCVPADLETSLVSARADLDLRLTIGWAGFTATHPHDLQVTGDAVYAVQRDTGCGVRVIGDGPGAARIWGTDVETVQPASLGAAYYTALTTLDVGLVPLATSNFNKAKSYLKALEYAACGVLVVASDTPVHRELARTVPMELADTPSEWQSALTRLLTATPERRDERVAEARAAVFTHHTYEGNAERWAAAWERAMTRRERMSA